MTKLNKMKKKIKDDKAESNTIAVIFVMLLLIMTALTVIDTGIYFMNRNIVSNAATNGARLAAIYGGTGGKNGTPIAKSYGQTVPPSCKNNANPVNCAVEAELENSNLVNVQLGSKRDKIVAPQAAIKCGPTNTAKIGERTFCEITWTYAGVPGSALSFIQHNPTNVTKLSAESEVIYNGK